MKIWKNNIIGVVLLILLVSSPALTQKRKMDAQRLRLAQQYERLGHYEKSLEIYKSLFSTDPQNMIYYDGVKRNLLHLKRFQEAVLFVENMLKIKNSLRIQVDWGDVCYRSGNEKKALKIWYDILEKNPRNPSAYQLVVNVMMGNRMFDEAVEVYQKAREQIGDPYIFTLELANLYFARADYRNATLEHLKYLKKNPRQFAFVEARIASYTEDPEVAAEVTQVLREKLQSGKEWLVLRQLLAGLFRRNGNYGAALEQYRIMEEAASKQKNASTSQGRELFEFAEKALRDGAYSFSEQAYSMILTQYPESPYMIRAKYGLARSFYQRGLYQQALDAYYDLINTHPKSSEAKEAWFQIGKIKLYMLFDPEGAQVAFNAILKNFPLSPKHYETMFKLGDALVAEGKLDDALKWYKKPLQYRGARNNASIREQALFKQAQLAFWTGKIDEALTTLDEICKAPPAKKDGLRGYGRLVNDALELSLLLEENKDDPNLLKKYARAQLLQRQRKYADAANKLRGLVEQKPQATIADEALLKLGELEFAMGNYQEAIQAYQRLITQYPQSVYCDQARKKIGEVYEKGFRDYKKAQQQYELVLENYPQSLLLEELRKKIRALDRKLEQN